MDPLADKYCVFPSVESEVRQIGNFFFRWKKGETSRRYRASGYYEYSVKHGESGKWVSTESYFYKSAKAPTPELKYAGQADMLSRLEPIRQFLHERVNRTDLQWPHYGGGTILKLKPELWKEFEATIKEDYSAWRKARRKLRAGKLEAEASSEGVSLQEKYEELRKHQKAVHGVATLNLKIEILQHFEKQRMLLESAATALENDTFDQAMASSLRMMGKGFGSSGDGLFPKMRKVASLIRKK